MMPSDQPSRTNPAYSPAEERGGGKKSRRSSVPKGRKDSKVVLILAILLGLVGALAIMVSLGDEAAPESQIYVVRAARDITAWTEVTEGDLEAVPMDIATLVPADSFRNATDEIYMAATPEAAVQSVFSDGAVYIRSALRLGQVLYKEQVALGSRLSQALAEEGIEIAPGDRIISVEATPANAAGGAIRPGDRVDLIIADSGFRLAKVLLADIPVLYVNVSGSALESIYSVQMQEPGRAVTDLQPSDPLPGIYTLAIPAAHADEIALFASRNETTLVLALRHQAADDADHLQLDENGRQPATRTISVLEVLCPADQMPTPESIFDPLPVEGGEPEVTVALPETCVDLLLQLRDSINRNADAQPGIGDETGLTGFETTPAGTGE